ncbi:hypothetical protein V2G26_021064 [Clonostachys chloroleuca]
MEHAHDCIAYVDILKLIRDNLLCVRYPADASLSQTILTVPTGELDSTTNRRVPKMSQMTAHDTQYVSHSQGASKAHKIQH